MNTFLIVALIGTLPLSHAFAGDSNATAKELVENAPRTLRNTKKFIIGRVYEDGRISESELAFRALLKREDAVKQFRALIKEDSLSCQLYALLGLRLLAAGEFDAEYDRLKGSVITVPTMSGCITFQTAAGDVAEDIKLGKIK